MPLNFSFLSYAIALVLCIALLMFVLTTQMLDEDNIIVRFTMRIGRVTWKIGSDAAAGFRRIGANPVAHPWTMRDYFNRAESYRKQFDYRRALADYTEVLKRDPDNSTAQFHRAFCNVKQKQYRQAVTDLDAVIQRSPGYDAAYRLRSIACLQINEFHRAIDDLTVVIAAIRET